MPADLPLVAELIPAPAVEAALMAIEPMGNVVLFDSALVQGEEGRYSFLTADPFWLHSPDGRSFSNTPRSPGAPDPLQATASELGRYRAVPVAELPPFQGGAAGLLTYELGRAFERLPPPQLDEFGLPSLAVGIYDWVISWDHASGRAWIVSQGFPEIAAHARRVRAAARLAAVRERLGGPAEEVDTRPGDLARLEASNLARQWPAPGLAGLTSNFSRVDYLRAVERAIEYIHAGDAFQVNLSQRLLYPWSRAPLELYLRLRGCNPAPFAGYFTHEDWAVASASPERFVSVRSGVVETRPIKGTRRRHSGPEADLFSRDELRESAKDQAENVMIVDLLRNDLSRVCQPGSIKVRALCQVMTYETVQHLVSVIEGRLEPERSAWDVFRAAFPGGSVTGAPKIRAMEIISELEPTARGAYCGSLFYVGFDGTADSSILIRTFTIKGGWVQIPVGGGIVAQSHAPTEYEETLCKAEGMLRALAEPPAPSVRADSARRRALLHPG